MSATATREDPTLFDLLIQANELGVRLEIVRGLPLWEAQPVMKHQRAIDRIRASIEPQTPAALTGCRCFHVSDVALLPLAGREGCRRVRSLYAAGAACAERRSGAPRLTGCHRAAVRLPLRRLGDDDGRAKGHHGDTCDKPGGHDGL